MRYRSEIIATLYNKISTRPESAQSNTHFMLSLSLSFPLSLTLSPIHLRTILPSQGVSKVLSPYENSNKLFVLQYIFSTHMACHKNLILDSVSLLIFSKVQQNRKTPHTSTQRVRNSRG